MRAPLPTPHLRLALLTLSATLLVTAAGARGAEARVVTGIAAAAHTGQTFVTWTEAPAPGWRYRVYRSVLPIGDATGLSRAELLGVVSDSSATDRRRSELLGSLVTFRIDSAASPLPPASGLFVRTADAGALAYYAVLAESAGAVQDSSLTAGANRTAIPVAEWPEVPLPIWQRNTVVPATGDDYVLWVQSEDTPTQLAMSNRPSTATYVTVRRGLPGRPLVLFGHARGGNSFQALLGSGYPGESILCIEDHLPTGDQSSFTFGYSQDYDPERYWNMAQPPGRIVIDYTERRTAFVLDWARRSLGHDPMRLYVWGGSMGGSLAFFLAYHDVDRVAGSLGLIPKLCTAYTPDSYLDLRVSFDRIWGRLENTPRDSNGRNVFDWMDGRWLASERRVQGAAPHALFFGRRDSTVGWPEKIAYAQAMQANRVGGALFWDTRGHADIAETTEWAPEQRPRRLHAYRLDRSFPALSHCTADGDMGDGSPDDGDAVGTINGAIAWDSTFVDEPDRWECTLRTAELMTRTRTIPAPDSAWVDVTPRRLQRFLVATGVTYSYEVLDVASGYVVQSGSLEADPDALLTIPQVRVTPAGSRLAITHPTTGAPRPAPPSAAPAILLGANPARGGTSLAIRWPRAGAARVRLLDTAGRHVHTLLDGPVEQLSTLHLPTASLAPGLYWIDASQHDARATLRVVVLR